jgi:hypothetical protein
LNEFTERLSRGQKGSEVERRAGGGEQKAAGAAAALECRGGGRWREVQGGGEEC